MICVCLVSHDSVRFVNAPQDTYPSLREMCQKAYGYGLHGSKGKGGDKVLTAGLAYEVILGGWPWRTTHLEEALYARLAILEIFRELREKGYKFRGITSGDNMYFEQVLFSKIETLSGILNRIEALENNSPL